MNALQKTALSAAAHRALSTKVNDMYARHLAGADLVESKHRARAGTRFIEARTQYIDKVIEKSNKKNVVFIGAGMDTRAYRLQSLVGKCVHETDFPEVLGYKRNVLKQLKAKQKAVMIRDFHYDIYKDDFRNFSNALFVAEGLLYYIQPEGVRNFFQSIPPNCDVVFDTINNNMELANLLFKEHIETELHWGTDDVRAFLALHNITTLDETEYIAEDGYRNPNLRSSFVHGVRSNM